MSVIATALKHLIAAGVTGDALVAAVADMEASQPKDAAAERRRAWDRERKREAKAARSGGIPVDSAESVEKVEPAPLSRPPNEKISNPPTHTSPDINTRAKADPFPKPEWADPQVWADWLKARKRKGMVNTATAHKRFLADIATHTDEDWPPGRLLEHAAGKGWGSINKPEGISNGRPATIRAANDFSGVRGSRPNPALDMVLQAERDEQAEAERENPWPDRTPRLALPSLECGGPEFAPGDAWAARGGFVAR